MSLQKKHHSSHTFKSFQPRKRFGQHFLIDTLVIHRLLHAIAPKKDDTMIEIGPGLGALTNPLLDYLPKLTVIEVDPDIKAAWPPCDALHWILADALTVDLNQFTKPFRLVGNLPYNISTPLIFHFLNFIENIQDMHFMLQKEVVDRMAATPGNKDYGRLSILLQYHCQVDYLFEVAPEAFNPPPAVDSAIVRLTPHHIYPKVPSELLSRVVAQAFGMRRKTIANNFKKWLTAEQLLSLNISPQQRPENLSIQDYIRVTQFLMECAKL